MSSAELSLFSCWSAAADKIGMQGRRAILQQALGRWVVSAAATADERAARGAGVRAGAGAVLPPRQASSSEPAAVAASHRPAGSGTSGSGSPGDDDRALLAAATAPSPSADRRLTAEMALSILVDCFGH